MLKEREDIIFHLILDPTYDNEHIFLESLVRTFKIETAKSSPTTLDYKEILKDYLFMKGVQENKTVVLVVDECQKLNQASLEVLRVLLNYETTNISSCSWFFCLSWRCCRNSTRCPIYGTG
jgi:general secretion pathway protein A